jgi:hypothetical protein
MVSVTVVPSRMLYLAFSPEPEMPTESRVPEKRAEEAIDPTL